MGKSYLKILNTQFTFCLYTNKNFSEFFTFSQKCKPPTLLPLLNQSLKTPRLSSHPSLSRWDLPRESAPASPPKSLKTLTKTSSNLLLLCPAVSFHPSAETASTDPHPTALLKMTFCLLEAKAATPSPRTPLLNSKELRK